jgi:fumarate reductase flavoprotein subunit
LGKNAEKLTKKIETGPFYAVKLYANAYGSMGGIVTDKDGRVLDEDGNVILNLYAAGTISNGDFYNEIYRDAASLAFTSAMGRLAGIHAANN